MSTPAHATLVARDIVNYGVDGVTDAFYDTDLNITWLRNANMNVGEMDFLSAMSWADSLVIGAFSDWRLPTSKPTNGSVVCQAYGCTSSEMGHLYYTELQNTANHFTNRGDFQNLLAGPYWSSTDRPVGAGSSPQTWVFGMRDGFQWATTYGYRNVYAMAVRNGDVLAVTSVPEPESYALLLAGLGVVSGMARRRKQKNAAS